MTASGRQPDLTTTMRFDPMDGIVDLEERLADLTRAACDHKYRFDRHGVRNELHAATFRLRDAASVRVAIGPSGAVAIETRRAP